MQKITPFLWFKDNAEEAANFYVSRFKNSKINGITRYCDGAPKPKGSVMTVDFQLEGQSFIALNGGDHFHFSPAISFYVNCETQEELDEFWDRLSEGGEKSECGWLTDKYGVTWQIVPSIVWKMLQDGDAAKSQQVLKAVWQMKKLDIKTIEQAYAGE